MQKGIIEYALVSKPLESGKKQIVFEVTNKADAQMKDLDWHLHSLDTQNITVSDTKEHRILSLAPGETETIAFDVITQGTGHVYLSLDAKISGDHFYWESPAVLIRVGPELAELESVFALQEPYVPLGQVIECEACVRSITDSDNLRLEMYAEDPEGNVHQIEDASVGKMAPEELLTYKTRFRPQKEGRYVIHGYLFFGADRLDHKMDYAKVTAAEA